MKFLAYNIIGLLLLTSCMQTQERELNAQSLADIIVPTTFTPQDPESHGNISILNSGPKGGDYQSKTGTNFRYTIFRIQVINDTIVPIILDFTLPTKSILLQPDSVINLEAFLISEDFTPNSIRDTFNFGVRMEDYFESEIERQRSFKTSVQPKEQHTFYIGILYKSDLVNQKTRTKLFIEGLDNDAPHYPVNSVEKYRDISNPTNLFYGISVDPPTYHALIPCGQIRFE